MRQGSADDSPANLCRCPPPKRNERSPRDATQGGPNQKRRRGRMKKEIDPPRNAPPWAGEPGPPAPPAGRLVPQATHIVRAESTSFLVAQKVHAQPPAQAPPAVADCGAAMPPPPPAPGPATGTAGPPGPDLAQTVECWPSLLKGKSAPHILQGTSRPGHLGLWPTISGNLNAPSQPWHGIRHCSTRARAHARTRA